MKLSERAKWWIFFCAIIAVIVWNIFWLSGCSMLGSARTTAPGAGMTETTESTKPDGTKEKHSRTYSATGTGTTATGEKVDQQSEAQPATIGLPDGTVLTGGGGTSRSKAMGSSLTGLSSPLLWVGIACFLLAAVAVWRGWNSLIVPAAGAGVVFIAVAFYPWLMLWAVLALVVIVGGPYVWAAIQAKRATEAARALTETAASLPTEAKAEFEKGLTRAVEGSDMQVIQNIVKKDDLPKIGVPS